MCCHEALATCPLVDACLLLRADTDGVWKENNLCMKVLTTRPVSYFA